MRTSRPAARAAHAFSHLDETDFYAAGPGLVLLGGCHPAYPFIPCQWRDARPDTHDNLVGRDGVAKIRWHRVHRTGSDRLSSHGRRSLQAANRCATAVAGKLIISAAWLPLQSGPAPAPGSSRRATASARWRRRGGAGRTP